MSNPRSPTVAQRQMMDALAQVLHVELVQRDARLAALEGRVTELSAEIEALRRELEPAREESPG